MSNKDKYILIVGGSGFIGSQMVLVLKENGFLPIILDNLSHQFLEKMLGVSYFIKGNLEDKNLLEEIFNLYPISAVMHFASFIDIAESIKYPSKYYQNNIIGTLNLLEMMRKHEVKRIIYSSTASVYGEPRMIPIDETHPIGPTNPYGRSKYMVEQIIKDYAMSEDLNFIIFRYFNAAGADRKGRAGECHQPETHLIPCLLRVAINKVGSINVFGQDYNTKDGTCVRDYIHVEDLCQAHLLGLKALLKKKVNKIYNLGNGKGFSVMEVIKIASAITGYVIPYKICQRRLADPPILVADSSRAVEELGWIPRYGQLEIIISHAWNYLQDRKI